MKKLAVSFSFAREQTIVLGGGWVVECPHRYFI
jgi:hypothetical protein